MATSDGASLVAAAVRAAILAKAPRRTGAAVAAAGAGATAAGAAAGAAAAGSAAGAAAATGAHCLDAGGFGGRCGPRPPRRWRARLDVGGDAFRGLFFFLGFCQKT